MADTVVTRYFRPVNHTVNGLTAYQIWSVTTGDGPGYVWIADGTGTYYFNFDVIIRHSDNSEDVIGSSIAQTSRASGSGLVTQSWNCPSTNIVSTDALKVVGRVIKNTSALLTYISNIFSHSDWPGTDKERLVAAPWTFQYHTNVGDDGEGTIVGELRLSPNSGSPYHSYISGITYGLAPSDQNVSPTSVASQAAIGSPTITAETTISPTSVASQAAIGNPTVINQLQIIYPAGVVSQAAIGIPGVVLAGLILPSGIPSQAAVGTPFVVPGGVTLQPTGIASQAAVGTPILQTAYGPKRLIFDYPATGLITYGIIRREDDNYLMDDADGSFAVNPVDPYVAFSENGIIKGRYERDEARQIWADGVYTVVLYKQLGGSPTPSADTLIGNGELVIKDDQETYRDVMISSRLAAIDYTAPDNAGIQRLLGLALENHVEDDIVRDGSGNKTSSILYCYDSAAHVSAHVAGGGGGTGLIAKYQTSFSYAGGRMTLNKVTRLV